MYFAGIFVSFSKHPITLLLARDCSHIELQGSGQKPELGWVEVLAFVYDIWKNGSLLPRWLVTFFAKAPLNESSVSARRRIGFEESA